MNAPRKRRWFAFRLRTMLVVVVVAGVVLTPLAVKLKKAREQKKAVAWVLEKRGSVTYDWEPDDGSSATPPGPKWLRSRVGDECFQTVRSVSFADHFGNAIVSDLSPLKVLTNLQQLDLLGAQRLSDLTPLKELNNLQRIRLQYTQVNDLAPLQELTNLVDLDLYGTQVSDLLPLQELTNLRELNLGETQVNDLLPLQELTNLRELNLWGTHVSRGKSRSYGRRCPTAR